MAPRLLLIGILATPPALAAQLAPPSTGGFAAFDRALQQVTESRRVLVIAAHPDDEDTALLTLMARGRGADAAYLALTRGEGGQNLIGPELGVGLGIVRTGELEAARAVDGAHQFFTRAYDFGYTRSLEETARHWPVDSLLKDVVRVVRRFRPDVIVAVFTGTARDGHGQHQLSGVLAQQAWEAAGDPDRFPELASEEGLAPWAPAKLYQSARFGRTVPTLELPLGGIDPRVGRTYRQLAAESRSQHRSQDFGTLQRLGPAETGLTLARRRTTGDDADLFAGIPRDTSWLTRLADSLRGAVAPVALDRAVPVLAGALRRAGGPPPPLRGARPERSVRLLQEALLTASEVIVDAWVERGTVLPGESLTVELAVHNGGARDVRLLAWGVTGARVAHEVLSAPVAVTAGAAHTEGLALSLPVPYPVTQPYYLSVPLAGAVYDWRDAPPPLRGLPDGPPALVATALLEIDGAWVRVDREVSHRWADQAIGEIREPLRVIPRIEVRLATDQILWNTSGPDRQDVQVRVTNNGPAPASVTVSLSLDGWLPPAPRTVTVPPRGSGEVAFAVVRPPGLTRAAVTVQALATSGGETFTGAMDLIAYPHIRPRAVLQPATGQITLAPLALPRVGRVGYVRGAADRVPEALERVGLPIEVLAGDDLGRSDLARYGAIVIGARAYETDPGLARHNARLLDYVRRGGRLIVQYQQYQYVREGHAPYPLDIARPHDRITDEAAPVTVLLPRHPVFHRPNPIGPADWEGWVQERGLYFAHTWAPDYAALLEMRDPDRVPVRGGLLAARHGKGTYIYTGLSFFRELPAGVPGAFRLFLNLLAWDGNDGR